ncbi:GGDEF domain-containing protein [Pseudoduganella sp. OTU4001]|uniref:GGDEF domain-containing protein n=1 Tax=Pseudoduganella sp. OTU4001 TaxID=3043854 RepID=UPI00313E35E8
MLPILLLALASAPARADAPMPDPAAAARFAQGENCMELAAVDPAAARERVRQLQPGAKPDLALHLRICDGYAEERAGRNEQALVQYEAAVSEARTRSLQRLLALALALRGEQNGLRGLYAAAISDLKEAYQLELEVGTPARQVYALGAIANLYADRNVKDYDNALAHYRKVLAANEAAGNVQGQATDLFNIGSTLESQGKLDEALQYLQRALELDRKRGVNEDIAFDEKAVAVVLSKLGRHEDALRLLGDVERRYGKDAAPDDLAAFRLSRGVALKRAGRYAQALPDIDAARAFFLSQNNLRFLETIHDERAQVLAALGDWREAFNARGDYQVVRQKLQDQLLDERTTRLRVLFDSEQKQRQNEVLARENELAQRELRSAESARHWQLAALLLALGGIGALALLMSRQVKLARTMRELALTDELTRLPNRRHFLALAEAALAHAQQSGGTLAMAGLDIDFFKKVNDTYGHAAGDVLLQRVAHALRQAIRPSDTVGRMGGEEFSALLRDAAPDQAREIAERMRAAVQALDCSDIAPDLKPTISIGLSQLSARGDRLDSLCKRADDALYRAKENGRNRVES